MADLPDAVHNSGAEIRRTGNVSIKRRWTTLLRTILLVVGAGLAAWGVAVLPNAADKTRPFWFVVAGSLLGAAALFGVRPRLDPLSPMQPARPKRPILGGALLLFGLASSVAGSVILTMNWQTYFVIVALWIIAVPVAAMGLNLIQGFNAILPSNKGLGPDRRWTKLEIAVFVLIVAVAAFLRFHRLDYFPPPNGVIAVEEPQCGLRAYRILETGYIPWEFAAGNLLAVSSITILGWNYTALRLPSILLSILTVAFLYLLMRELVGRWARVGATVLFAFSTWHLIYSRPAHGVFTPVAFSVLLFYFLIRTRTAPKLSAFVWLGVVTFILMVSYAPFRAAGPIILLFYLGVGIAGLIRMVFRRKRRPGEEGGSGGPAESTIRSPRAANPAGLLITVGVCFMLFYPTWVQIQRNAGYPYLEAWGRSSRFGAKAPKVNQGNQMEEYAIRMKTIWKIFNVSADNGTIGLRCERKLDPVAGTMFVLALGYLLLSCWRGYNGFLILIFLVSFHALGLFAASFDVLRLTGLVPMVFVLIGLWLGALETWSLERFCAWGKRCYAVLLIAGMSAGSVWNWHLYFDRFITDTDIRRGYVTYHSVMAGTVSELPPGSRVIAFAPLTSNVVTVTSDSDWLVPKGLRGTGCNNTDELIDALKDLTPGEEVILLIQRPVYLDGMERLLGEMLGCGQFNRINNPDNPVVTISKVTFTVPQNPSSFENFRERAREASSNP